MERVILCGTTTGTTWRLETTGRLVMRNVAPGRIYNPHLPKGVKYTPRHMEIEGEVKNDPSTIVLVHICPAVMEDPELDDATRLLKSELIGPISAQEIWQYGWSEPERTAIVLASDLFTPGRRPRQVLEGWERQVRY